MNRRKVLALAGVAGIGGFSGCLDENRDDTGETGDEETEEASSEDMAGAYDFSPCEYDLNGEKISYSPLDETVYNNPQEDDKISVGIGYYEDIEDDELRELDEVFGDEATRSDGSQSISTGRDGIHRCDVAKLSNRDYIEYIVPLPVDEE